MTRACAKCKLCCSLIDSLWTVFWRSVYPYLKPFILLFPFCFCANLGAQERRFAFLSDLSIEDLGNIRVTSVSKNAERLRQAPASIYVITHEAIRRSGAQSLPEALRLAPNLLVAQISANNYAISARGFNSNTANKLLVLIDGRTVYTPLYSGVFWDAQDVLLQDIDRIEVISGAGGALWGANAVNGVINITTLSASKTLGNMVFAQGGDRGRTLALRHGGSLPGQNAGYRLYGKVNQWLASALADGSSAEDAWDSAQLGFRTDWRQGDNVFSLQGDTYSNRIDRLNRDEQQNSGFNLLTRWTRRLAGRGKLKVQFYVDQVRRDTPGTYKDRMNTVDVDVQHSLAEKNGRQWIWGGGYRIADDHASNSAALAFLPADQELYWGNLFTQYQQTFSSKVQIVLGAKVETNQYTGVELLPVAKVSWQLSTQNFIWLSASRSVRAPSRLDADLYIPGTAPYALAGGDDFRSEIANTLELGWRTSPNKKLRYSLVSFFSQYKYLRSVDSLPGGQYVLGNQIDGQVNGLEGELNYQPIDGWSLMAGLLLLDKSFSGGNIQLSPQGNDPRAQVLLSSKWKINEHHFLDVRWRHVEDLPEPAVTAYDALDMHFGWKLTPSVELVVSGRNLLDPYHQEFASGSGARLDNPIQVERSLDLAITARFK